jgi:hypothetical protein
MADFEKLALDYVLTDDPAALDNIAERTANRRWPDSRFLLVQNY